MPDTSYESPALSNDSYEMSSLIFSKNIIKQIELLSAIFSFSGKISPGQTIHMNGKCIFSEKKKKIF